MVFAQDSGEWCGHKIEFAVYGKQVIREGEILNISRITHEFSDLRHLFWMPNLNPDSELFKNDPGRPRSYFRNPQYENIWLGEAQLLEHRNEQRQAYFGPVFLSLAESNASEDQVRGALKREGYKEEIKPRKSLKEGEFRFVPENSELVEVFFKHNTYAWSMIGLNKENNRIICLACDGIPGGDGYILNEAAEKLREVGVYNALVMDEGFDVFQMAELGIGYLRKQKVATGNELDVLVPRQKIGSNCPLNRTRLRATFIFAKKINFPNNF